MNDKDKFIVVYKSYNGVLCHIARHLHITHRTAKKLEAKYGLKPYPYLTIAQAAERLGISRSTMEYWVYAGKFPTVKVTGKKNQHHLITEQAVRDFTGIEYPQFAIQEGYQSVTEVARQLNYSVAMVRRKCQQGKLPAKKNPYGTWMVKNVAI